MSFPPVLRRQTAPVPALRRARREPGREVTQLDECVAHGIRKGPFQPLAERLPIRLALQYKSVHPAVAAFEHLDQQVFHLLPAVIAPQKQFLNSLAESRAGLVDLFSELRGLRGDRVPRAARRCRCRRPGRRAAAAARPARGRRNQSSRCEAERAGRAASSRAPASATGRDGQSGIVRVSCLSQLIENPIAHLGGGGVGEGNGDDLAGLIHLAQQAEKAFGKQVVLPEPAGACTRIDLAGVKSALALDLIGRLGFAGVYSSPSSSLPRIVLVIRVAPALLNAAEGLQAAAFAGLGGIARVYLGLSSNKIFGQLLDAIPPFEKLLGGELVLHQWASCLEACRRA